MHFRRVHIAGPAKGRTREKEMQMKRFDLLFLTSATGALLVGVSLGIFMGIRQDFTLAPVHAHLNLLGWASLALFGLTYRAYPELGADWMAKAHALLAVPSALLLAAGIGVAMLYHDERLVTAGSLGWLASCLIFLFQLIRLTVAHRRQTLSQPKG
jgi:hypothetical protein